MHSRRRFDRAAAIGIRRQSVDDPRRDVHQRRILERLEVHGDPFADPHGDIGVARVQAAIEGHLVRGLVDVPNSIREVNASGLSGTTV